MAVTEQYLHTSFEHDAEFVDGRVVERPAPFWAHASMQGFLIRELRVTGRNAGMFVVPEQRVRVSPSRFRVPDVCVVRNRPADPAFPGIVTEAPYLCAEVQSPEDSMAETLERVAEYLNFGVNWVWIIDPVSRCGQVYGPNSVRTISDGIFTTDRFTLDVNQAEY